MRVMVHTRIRLLFAIGLLAAVATPITGRQDAPSLQGTDPPASGIWVDSLDLTNVAIRRGRGQRGSTVPPPPLVYKLAGVTYPHALALQSDADVAIDLGGAATKFVAMIGVDDGTPPAAPPAGVPAPAPPAPGSVVFGAWVDGRKVFESDVMHR